ncbi:MAG: hypothetical protein WC955_03915 [Elusimicrobiota bacterium]
MQTPAYIIDVLKVPEAGTPVIGITWGISVMIFSLVFVVSLLTEQANLISDGKSNLKSVLWNSVLTFFCLLVYRYLFRKIISFCELSAMCILSTDKWFEFMTVAVNLAKTDSAPGSFLSINITTFVMNIVLLVSIAIEEIFNFIRFIFLLVLYITGPICISFYLWKPTSGFFGGWLLSTFQVSFWIVILRIMQTAYLSFNTVAILQSGDPLLTIVFSICMIAMFVLTPVFTANLLSGQTVSTLGTAVIGLTGFAFSKFGALRVKDMVTSNGTKVPVTLQSYVSDSFRNTGKAIGSALGNIGKSRPAKPPDKGSAKR